MADWQSQLSYDPLPTLLSSENEPLIYFVERDLLEKKVLLESLWELPDALRLVKKQQKNGSLVYPGKNRNNYPDTNYDLLETFRNTGILVEKYGFTAQHPAILKAAHYLFSCQTDEGDFRGIYGNEYSPNYTVAIMELLIKAGYNNRCIEKGFHWLLSLRQMDGGWAAPLRTIGVTNTITWFKKKREQPVNPDTSKPSSHFITGMVLRAFAAHPVYRRKEEAQEAGILLLSRFFRPDTYVDRKDKSYWEKVSFPFWFTDIVSALDSLSVMGFLRDNPHINGALTWLKNKQRKNGLFELKFLRDKDKELSMWVSLAICRILKRVYS
ncbi:MAG: hypothetical protein HXS54_17755 [Theionarchaea archaeon]|nr:hypothetical protein [Theionarchaea archaeon]